MMRVAGVMPSAGAGTQYVAGFVCCQVLWAWVS